MTKDQIKLLSEKLVTVFTRLSTDKKDPSPSELLKSINDKLQKLRKAIK